MFPINYSQIIERIDSIDPRGYARSRNYIDGDVSRLSPYISRGVISTSFVMKSLFNKGFSFSECEKFLQELAWRDYWQQVWVNKGEAINEDLKHKQPHVGNYGMPTAVINSITQISTIDDKINELYDSGYMHNHVRMYVASICCNNAKSHWITPAQWMYYHLKDGDWASNALSWQWVAGSNSNKKYIANQENINRYCHTNDHDTFLDKSYEEIANMPIPEVLTEISDPIITLDLPETENISIDESLPTLLYNYYNLDPQWRTNELVNRVFILEPQVFNKYPVSRKNIEFAIQLAKEIIPCIQIFIGELEELKSKYNLSEFIYKEHPLNNYQGTEDSRDWMFPIKGYYSSFFGFWKKCKKEFHKDERNVSSSSSDNTGSSVIVGGRGNAIKLRI